MQISTSVTVDRRITSDQIIILALSARSASKKRIEQIDIFVGCRLSSCFARIWIFSRSGLSPTKLLRDGHAPALLLKILLCLRSSLPRLLSLLEKSVKVLGESRKYCLRWFSSSLLGCADGLVLSAVNRRCDRHEDV